VRCVIHPTASGSYLPPDYPTRTEQRLRDLGVAVPMMVIALCIVAALIAWVNRWQNARRYYGHRRHHDESSQPPGPPPPTQDPDEGRISPASAL